ncbi:MAG: Nif3-like dinuclear metal center hexameric protein [Blautia sp.]|nr:Nif3-like dinuclear metal center hexameric protein [Blautia sp.]MDY5032166.1 Nif3-like dinuclear metal center hexameric protein [Blautia sp.]
MKAYELTAWLNEQHPEQAAEDWDNVGLLVGDDTRQISHVFLALDLTEETLEEAVAAGADMIVTHHPMIFSGIKKINNHTFTGRRILKLLEKGIPYYAMHTNYDIVGMADQNAQYLGLTEPQVLAVTEPQKLQGLGKTGKLPRRMTLRECGEYVKACFRLEDVRVYGDPDQTVEVAAVCGGSGKSLLADVLAAGADVYITGDIDYHTGLDAVAQGLAVIDAGHYGTEYIFMENMEREIREAFPELKVSCARVKQPYMVL